MNLSISAIYKQFINFYKKLSKKTKIIAFSALAVLFIGIVIVSVMISNGKYSELYSGLSSTEAAEIYTVLNDMAVDVKVQDETTILVPTSEVATLKMQLAVDGYPKSTLSYDIFMNQSDLLTTDYEKKQLLIFQLQNRLQESIKTLQGVKNAIVTLSIPEDNSYVLANEKVDTTASVVIELNPNVELTSKQINGIEQLVANSVSGLSKDNVVIIDGEGNQLNVDEQTDTGVDSAYLKMETVNLINDVFEEKISDFLKPIFGENGISVAVNVRVDFDVKSTKETIYTPVIGENGIISWVERSGKSTQDTSGGSGVAGTGNNTDTPTYEQSNVVSDTSTVTSNDTSNGSSGDKSSSDSYSAEYLVNQLIREIQDNGGNITDMSVALVINANELSAESINQYKELVAYSAGISTDKVTVSYAKFLSGGNESADTSSAEPNTGIIASITSAVSGLGAAGTLLVGGILLLIILAFIVRKLFSNRKQKAEIKKLRIADKAFKDKTEQQGDKTEETPKKARPENMPGEIVLNETREQALKRQIKEFSNSNPETVAQLLRVWMKEDENN